MRMEWIGVLVVGLAACMAYAQEQGAKWTAAGWGGGGFYWACAFHPTKDGVIYLGGDVGGIYKTEDAGRHWRMINNGLSNYAVYSIAVDPNQPDVVYAVTETGICRSTDAGEHFTLLPATADKATRITSGRDKSVHNLAVSPKDSSVLYAGTPDGRILTSSDTGKTWKLLHEIKGQSIASIIISPADEKLILACTSAGLLRSTDAGATWASVAEGSFSSAVFDHSAPQRVFAAGKQQKVIKSADGGKTWSPAQAGIDQQMGGIDIAIDPVNPSTLYCIASEGWSGSFYRSTDGGEHWMRSNGFTRDPIGSPTLPQEPIGDGVSAPRCLAISPRNAGELYIACNWRPCYSNDGGKTWQERIAGADISCIYDIRFDGGKTYAVAMDEGLLCSDDNGARWRQLAPLRWNKEISGHQWRINIANGGKRIVTTVSPWDSPYNAVLLSEDGGATFQLVRKGLPDYIPKPNTMWGRSYPRALAADPKNPNVLYLGMDGDAEPGKTGGGIFKSEDGGKSWRQLPAQPGSRRSFMGLVVDPTDSRRIYWAASGTGGGVYRSEDAGGSWQRVFTNEEWIFNLAISPKGVLYAPGRNLWRSSDHGKTWQTIANAGNQGTQIVGLEVDPTNENRVWYSQVTWSSDTNGGIFETSDGGKHWQEITGAIPHRKPLVLRYNPATRELWAGGAGLYRCVR